MKNEILQNLLEKYLRGECSDTEVQSVYEWYNSFDDNDDLLNSLNPTERDALAANILEKVKKDIGPVVPDTDIPSVKQYKWPPLYLISAIAAAFILALGVVIYMQYGSLKKHDQQPVDKELVTNTTKSFLKKVLPDGSTVWLSPQSSVEYKKSFDRDKREVAMTGEAFFEVTKKPKRPFIIYSGKVTTRVWGTSFSISAYKNALVEVAVLTGKVAVNVPPSANSSKNGTENPDHVMLLPDQKATFLKNNTLQKSAIEDHSKISCWKKATMTFNDAYLNTVINVLNKKFDVHIVTNDPRIDQFKLKADFSDQNLADILEIMHRTININYEINSNNIVLKEIPN